MDRTGAKLSFISDFPASDLITVIKFPIKKRKFTYTIIDFSTGFTILRNIITIIRLYIIKIEDTIYVLSEKVIIITIKIIYIGRGLIIVRTRQNNLNNYLSSMNNLYRLLIIASTNILNIIY